MADPNHAELDIAQRIVKEGSSRDFPYEYIADEIAQALADARVAAAIPSHELDAEVAKLVERISGLVDLDTAAAGEVAQQLMLDNWWSIAKALCSRQPADSDVTRG